VAGADASSYISGMNLSEDVVGIVLAGGRSSRMGGEDKCLKLLNGKPILARVIDRLTPQVSDIAINANGEPSRFASFGLPVLADSVTGYAGPLAGVHAGLAWAQGSRPTVRYVVTVAADTPFFPHDLVRRFLGELPDGKTPLVARSAAGVHPVIGLWPVAIAPTLEAALKQGVRKVGDWTKQQGAIEVFFPPVGLGGKTVDPFFNINWPEDLAAADALLSGATP
jgi:molybdopterin-guanine dinucleotide biosynthesis protein A